MAKQRKLTVSGAAQVLIVDLVRLHTETFVKRDDETHERVEGVLDHVICTGDKKVRAMVSEAGYQME